MDLDKKKRVELVIAIAEKLDSHDLRFDHANIILQTYGVASMDDDQFGPSTAETVNTATDEQLIELAQHFELDAPSDAPAAIVTTTVKSSQPLFIFASHLTIHRVVVHQVASALSTYGINVFVAHDSIDVDTKWHDEIEKALDRADAGLAFLHKGISESPWCDQEIGWLLGRHVPVMALKFDAAPYGPLGKHQAATIRNETPDEIAEKLIERIAAKVVLAPGLAASLIDSIANSTKFNTTDRIWKHLRDLRTLDANQCAALLEATKDNTQIYKANSPWDSGRPYSRVIIEFLRQQPGHTVVASDIDAYEKYLEEKAAKANQRRLAVSPPPK